MFTKSVVATTLVALTAATVVTELHSECITGPAHCCDSTSSTVTPVITELLDSVGIIDQSVAVPIGVGDGATCFAQSVRCTDNSFGGVDALRGSLVAPSLWFFHC